MEHKPELQQVEGLRLLWRSSEVNVEAKKPEVNTAEVVSEWTTVDQKCSLRNAPKFWPFDMELCTDMCTDMNVYEQEIDIEVDADRHTEVDGVMERVELY